MYLLSFNLEFINTHFKSNMQFFLDELGVDDFLFQQYVLSFLKIVLSHPNLDRKKVEKYQDDLEKIYPYVEGENKSEAYKI